MTGARAMAGLNTLDPRTWGITARLVLVATVPAFIMFAAVTVWLYRSATADISADLDERAGIIAGALAEASPYGLASGNTDYLERSMRGLRQRDSSVAGIEILDATRRVVERSGNAAPGSARPPVEVEVRSEVPDVDIFDAQAPHVSQPGSAGQAFKPGPVVGFVRVSMSIEPMLIERRQRLLSSALIVALSTGASVLAGLWLAQRLRSPLRAAMGALQSIRKGNYDLKLNLGPSTELRELQRAILAMAASLRASRRELESEVEARTQELKATMGQLQSADAERRRLIVRGNALIEEERQRIAREIHDHLNAELIVVRLQAQHIAATAAQAVGGEAAREIEGAAERINRSTSALYASARAIVRQLRPEMLDMLGLAGALREMMRQYDELHPDCRFSFEAQADLPELPGSLAITAYRLVQEALSNLVKHAAATQARVNLAMSPDGQRMVLEVADNGRGFDAPAAMRSGTGTGIIGMRERVAAHGGKMLIGAGAEGGTTIRFELPLVPVS
jgi:two-component system, NarL family, sensor histidine kinase UhpB